MENWVIEILKILGGAVAGVLLAETVPSIRALLKRSSLSLNNRKIAAIRHEYEIIRGYEEDYAKLAVHLIRTFARAFILFMGLFVVISIAITSSLRGRFTDSFLYTPYFIGFWAGLVLNILHDIHITSDRVTNFEKYREKTIKDLKKLGATLQENKKQHRR